MVWERPGWCSTDIKLRDLTLQGIILDERSEYNIILLYEN